MNSLSIDPLLLEYAAPALLAGLVVGAVGAEFLAALKKHIETPASVLI